MPNETYFVASPGDYQKAIRTGTKSIAINYKLFGDGTLKRASTATISNGDIMGISDSDMENVPQKVDALLDDILYEVLGKKCDGVLFDFENKAHEMYPFVSILSLTLAQRGIKHYLPERFHSAAPYAELIAECAVSGGSLEHYYQQIKSQHMGRNISFEITAIRMDFEMPSYNAEGKYLSRNMLEDLISKYNPMIFFSSELVSKYFTYQCTDGSFHFVLFDDRSTIQEKIRFFKEKGDSSVFVLYSDWEGY